MKIYSSCHAARFLLFVILAGLPSYALAQSFAGSVSGAVTDASGGVLPNAKVTLVNERTNETRTQTTSENGLYAFPQVRPVPTGSKQKPRPSRRVCGLPSWSTSSKRRSWIFSWRSAT